jgi:hypothetical protein
VAFGRGAKLWERKDMMMVFQRLITILLVVHLESTDSQVKKSMDSSKFYHHQETILVVEGGSKKVLELRLANTTDDGDAEFPGQLSREVRTINSTVQTEY